MAEPILTTARPAFRHDGCFVGRAGVNVWHSTGELELGYALLPALWGQRLARGPKTKKAPEMSPGFPDRRTQATRASASLLQD